MDGNVLRQIPLFESLGKDARDFIANRLKIEVYTSGELIVRQGDPGDSLYIITNGLVKVTKREKDGKSHELARLQTGDYFGEMSLLGGQPRSADIITVTDTTTLVLRKPDMDAILREYPAIAVHFSKVLSKRLRDVSQLNMSSKQAFSTVAIYSRYVDPLQQSILAFNLAASFTRELMKRVLLIDIATSESDMDRLLHSSSRQTGVQEMFKRRDILHEDNLSPFIVEHKTGFHILPLATGLRLRPRMFEKALTPLLNNLRASYDYIIINCVKDIRKLVQTALEDANLILYLTPTTNNAIQRCKKDIDMFVQGYGEHNSLLVGVLQDEDQVMSSRLLESALAPHQFVSLHKNTYITDRFLRTGRPFVYEYPKSNISRSLQHLTRRIGRVRVGLAFGSGAARGFAHVGILKVLEERDIPIDMITGVSMGAFVGGFYAAGVSAAELEEMVLSYQNKRKVRRTIFDITLPLYGFSKGNRLAKFMRGRLGDITFDELDIPFAAVATDISNGTEVVLKHGVLWQALRASGSVPVLFEPYHLEGRYLIDGAITNPLPTDILIERELDIIISCTVNSVKTPVNQLTQEAHELSRDDVIAVPSHDRRYGIFDAITRSMGIMSAANTLQKARLADIDIRPQVSHIDWTDFHRGDELIREGEKAATEALGPIMELLRDKRH